MSRATPENARPSRLRLFLNAAASQGLELGGVDSLDLYRTLYLCEPGGLGPQAKGDGTTTPGYDESTRVTPPG